MKAQRHSQSETLIDEALCVMHAYEKLVERRDAHAKEMEQFVKQREKITTQVLREPPIRATIL